MIMRYEIKTQRLLLRPLDVIDLDTVHEYASDEANTRFMQWLPNHTKAETLAFLQNVTTEWQKEQPRCYEFAMVLDGRQIGAVSVALDESRQVGELGWIVHKDWQKQGYALEAAQAVRDFAVEQLKVKKLMATCDARNGPSYRLMEKLGLRREPGVTARQYYKRDEAAEELTYSAIC